MEDFINKMKGRGLVAQVTHENEFAEHLRVARTAYTGFDPSAESLHVGHLIPIINLVRWRSAGHKPIVLLGGGTGYIGDPTGKSELRRLLDQQTLQRNIDAIERQLKSFFRNNQGPEAPQFINNLDWLQGIKYLEFLRDFGVCFSVNRMLAAECYKSRMETGLTFLEFNYMILQSYDFFHLHRHHGCTVQLGGDDQWSNMLGGVNLIRRIEGASAYCLTYPLLLTSSGKKMGKSESGAVWLDPNMTKPYDFFQYWRNISDEDIISCFQMVTLVDESEIEEIRTLQGEKINEAKIRLASAVTEFVHGEEEAQKCRKMAQSVFSKGPQLPTEAPKIEVKAGLIGEAVRIVDLMTLAKLVSSKGEARRLIQSGGCYVNNARVIEEEAEVTMTDGVMDEGLFLSMGKKKHFHLIFTQNIG